MLWVALIPEWVENTDMDTPTPTPPLGGTTMGCSVSKTRSSGIWIIGITSLSPHGRLAIKAAEQTACTQMS